VTPKPTRPGATSQPAAESKAPGLSIGIIRHRRDGSPTPSVDCADPNPPLPHALPGVFPMRDRSRCTYGLAGPTNSPSTPTPGAAPHESAARSERGMLFFLETRRARAESQAPGCRLPGLKHRWTPANLRCKRIELPIHLGFQSGIRVRISRGCGIGRNGAPPDRLRRMPFQLPLCLQPDIEIATLRTPTILPDRMRQRGDLLARGWLIFRWPRRCRILASHQANIPAPGN
jgi:hypothetical protein